mmetsp:Transcript_157294/g.286381  ORF Transcript_157294/g.286381 Transcript_157294/m.286381 type:complete len:331 (-) Transcript_157294:160-1152(-)
MSVRGLLLVALACAGHAQPVQMPSQAWQSQAFAELLLAGNPTAAFSPSGAIKPAQQSSQRSGPAKRIAQPSMAWSMEKTAARKNQLAESDRLPGHMYAEETYDNEDGVFKKDPMLFLEMMSTEMGPSYGRALWYAVEGEPRDFQEKAASDFATYAEIFLKDEEVQPLIESVNTPLSSKIEMVDVIGESLDAADILKEVLKEMMRESRFEWFKEASDAYTDYVSTGNKDQTVEVVTKSEDFMPEIEAKAKELVTPGYNPVISYKVDPTMASGFKMFIDGACEYNYDLEGAKADETTKVLTEASPLITRLIAQGMLDEAGWTSADFKAVGVE